MAKEISCINAGFEDCAFHVRSENEDEVIEFARSHAKGTHGVDASRAHLEKVMVEK